MTYIVELVEDQLLVQPIHRLINGLPDGFDLPAALEPSFGPASRRRSPRPRRLVDRMDARQPLPGDEGRRVPAHHPEAMEDVRALDSSRLDQGLSSVDGVDLTYQHGVEHILAAVESGQAQAGVLLRPATVQELTEVARRAPLRLGRGELAGRLGAVLGPLHRPEHADRGRRGGPRRKRASGEGEGRVGRVSSCTRRASSPTSATSTMRAPALRVEAHALLVVGAEADRLAVLERDEHRRRGSPSR